MIFILFVSVFLQRFGWNFGEEGVPFNLFASLLALAVLLLRGQLVIDPVRAALVLAFSAYALASLLFNFHASSPASVALLILSYLSFGFMLRVGDELFMDCIRAFRSMVLICAACGIAQFFLQAVISSPLLYTFNGFLPANILLKGFATYQPIEYGSAISRSNGFFMLEPSIFSQYVALAIIVEMLFFRTGWRLAVYAAAILFSYSGTGMIALVLIPGILLSRRSYTLLVTLILLGGLVLATSELLHLDVILTRSTELSTGATDTSAHARFQAPIDLINRYLLPYPHDLLFGMGPGSMQSYVNQMPYETHDPAWAKLLVEYGLLGSTLFGLMIVLALFVHSPSLWLSTALAIGFFTFGGELLDARLQSLLLIFCVLPKRAAFGSKKVFPVLRIAAKDASG